MKLPVVPPHEAVSEALGENPELLAQLKDDIASDKMPPAYTEHPVVVASSDKPVLPFALCCDGV
eukprot:15286838-Alexandrium_andersonii.AAC.1